MLIGFNEEFTDLLLYLSEFLLTVVLVVPLGLLALLTVTVLLLHHNHIRRLHLHTLRLLFYSRFLSFTLLLLLGLSLLHWLFWGVYYDQFLLFVLLDGVLQVFLARREH